MKLCFSKWFFRGLKPQKEAGGKIWVLFSLLIAVLIAIGQDSPFTFFLYIYINLYQIDVIEL